jgi:hypothetical protein
VGDRFSDQMAGYTELFLEEYGRSFTYKANGAGSGRTVKVIIIEDVAMYGQAGVMNVDELIIQMSARNNTEGAVSINDRKPNRDQFIDPDTAKTWYVTDILEDGNLSGAGMHTLRLKDKPIL